MSHEPDGRRDRQRRAHPDRQLPGRALVAVRLGPRRDRRARGGEARGRDEPEQVERVIMGNVLSAGMGQAPARQAVIKAGLPVSVGAVTINKVCGSGLQAVMFARREILVGDADVMVAGGMESMTNAPYLLPKARSGYRMGNGEIIDSMIHDGLWDPYDNVHMGNCGDVGRREVRLHARGRRTRSRPRATERALAAQKERQASRPRSCPSSVPAEEGRAGASSTRTRSPEARQLDKMRVAAPGLLEGRHRDGGERVAHQRRRRGAARRPRPTTAKQRGYTVLARIVADSTAAVEPKWFTIAPVHALAKLYEKTRHEAARLGPLRDQRGLLGRDDGGDEGARHRRATA